jgi:hypothetical protein
VLPIVTNDIGYAAYGGLCILSPEANTQRCAAGPDLRAGRSRQERVEGNDVVARDVS